MGKFVQQSLHIRIVLQVPAAGQHLLLHCRQLVLQILALGKAVGNSTGVRAVGDVACDGQIGVVHLGLEVLEAVLPQLGDVSAVAVPVPGPGEQLEVGHLVGLGVVHRVGQDAQVVGEPVGI